MVRDDAVDFFRIFQRAQATSRLHMADGNLKLYRCQRSSHRGIGIPENKQQIRLLLLQDLFQSNQHSPSHLPVTSAGDPQVVVRLWNIHFLKKNIRHIVVVMLPRVNQNFLKFPAKDPGHYG